MLKGEASEADIPYEVQIFMAWVNGNLPVSSPTLLDARTAQYIELIRQECETEGLLKR